MAMSGCDRKPRVLILGGCGFIGRNLVEYLLDNDLVSFIRVADKVPPQTAWLNAKHQQIFEHPLFEFKSANLINTVSCQNAFISDKPFNYVINCAGETKSGQTDPIYKEGIYKLSMNCAQQSAKLLVDRYVEISAGNFNTSEKNPLKEEDSGEPWTYIAKYKLQVENGLKNIPNLKYTILRPAIVYGCGDRSGLAPRLVVGAVYKHLGEMMKLLWGPELHMNTVHVRDVARAIWHVVNKPEAIGQTYNVVDEDMSSVVEEVNDKHMGPWAEACNKDGVENSPLSPYIDQELLYNKHLYLQPGKLSNTGFTYLYPKLTKDALREVLDDYVNMKIFPHSLVV
ncbi:uncharacterized protein LOC143182469 isoform X2 [Calliopsis andreniformis]|uniref:uncharacterized protein LOC143182469 isoform X2 n=1 Tax=Calliopsis andreniformis TaxID=337506 RepID=UPI003FCD8020